MNKLILMALTVCFVSCASGKKAMNERAEKAFSSGWYVETINGEQVNAEVNPFLEFDGKTGSYYGNAACNTVRGKFEYDAKKSKIQFLSTATTRMYCPDMEVENAFINALKSAESFDVTDSSLSLKDADGAVVATFVPKLSIDGKWMFEEVNGKKVAATDRIPFLEIKTAEARVHGNLGCNIYNSSIDFDMVSNAISFKAGQMTMMACPDMSIEDAIKTALQDVVSFTLDGDTLRLLDAGGEVLLLLVRD